MSIDFAANPGKEEKDLFFEKLRSFVVAHEINLQKMEQVFNDKWDITIWDARTDAASVVYGQPHDLTTIADTLGRSKLNNRLFFVMSMQVATLAAEMRHLAEECHELFIPPLCTFGDTALCPDGITDEEAQRGLGKMLPLLQDVWNWVQRVDKVVLLLMRNMGSLYSAAHQRDNYQPYTMVHFPVLWFSLADLLGAVAMLEEVLNDHDTVRQGIHVYTRILQQVAKNYDKYNADEFHVEQFGKLLVKLERDLLDDNILLRICTQVFDTPEITVHSNGVFFAEFNAMFRNILATVSDVLGTAREGEARFKFVGLCAMFVLHYHVFKSKLKGDPDVFKSFCTELYALDKKAPVVFINGLNVIKPGRWLTRRIPTNALSIVIKDPTMENMMAIKAECTRSAADFVPKINFLTTVVSVWISQMESTQPCDRLHAKHCISGLIQLLARGVQMAQDLSRTIKNVIFVHQSADLPLTKVIVEGIMLGVEQLMMMRNVFHNRTAFIASMFNITIQVVGHGMNQNIFTLYSKLNDALQTAGEAMTDQHTALGQAMVLLGKPQTPQNLLCLDVVLSIAFKRGDCYFAAKDYDPIFNGLQLLTKLCKAQKSFEAATNCSFLYWQREGFFPLFFSHIYQNPSKAHFLPYIVQALHDCRPAILASRHTDADKLLDSYKEHCRSLMKEHIIAPLCTELENDLRLYTHGAVLGTPYRKITKSPRDASRFTSLAPFRFFDEWYRISTYVEDYLDVQFYNLNALMTNDWKTYEEMRNLARERYGLRIAEGYLPGSIVDQGLDVLVITKNIHVFVANYTYNMNEQLFVQQPSTTESKHLNTLHIRHVANSIRTHGTGIMNTTVNYVYKCLLKKLSILSQFLFDDHVRSRLLKDIKYFTTHKDELNGRYPIQRADKFCNDMRKLGVSENGQTCLDQFRKLVSEIGNALGYMRMVRSGGLRAIADAAVFIPAMDNPSSSVRFEKYVNPDADKDEEEDELAEAVRLAKAEAGEDEDEEEEEEEKKAAPPSTVDSIRIVDDVVANMTKRLAQGSDYFKMLEEAIARKLNDEEKYAHLKNFYMIIPPMCVLHVVFMIKQKEQLVKRNKEGLFSEDGFALGCVFLLSLFGVFENFESLHWFEAVRCHFAQRQAEMREGIKEREAREKEKEKLRKKGKAEANTADDVAEDDLKTMQLTLTMVDSSVREYDDLENAFASCRVFFRYHDIDDNDEEEEEEEEED